MGYLGENHLNLAGKFSEDTAYGKHSPPWGWIAGVGLARQLLFLMSSASEHKQKWQSVFSWLSGVVKQGGEGEKSLELGIWWKELASKKWSRSRSGTEMWLQSWGLGAGKMLDDASRQCLGIRQIFHYKITFSGQGCCTADVDSQIAFISSLVAFCSYPNLLFLCCPVHVLDKADTILCCLKRWGWIRVNGMK